MSAFRIVAFVLAAYHILCIGVHFVRHVCLAGFSASRSPSHVIPCLFAHLATASVALYTGLVLL